MIPQNTRILIVEDLPSTRSLLCSMLAQNHLSRVFEATDGQSALELLETQAAKGEPIQVVLCDWNMPVMSGLELLEKLRLSPAYRKTPFLMITTEGDFSHVKQALERGVSNYVTKPLKTDVLMEKLNFVWDQHVKGIL